MLKFVNKISILSLFGLFILCTSDIALAEDDISTQRPSFFTQRLEGTNTLRVTFTSTMVGLETPPVMDLGLSALVEYAIIGVPAGDNMSNSVDVYKIYTSSPIRCVIGRAGGNGGARYKHCDNFRMLSGQSFEIDLSALGINGPSNKCITAGIRTTKTTIPWFDGCLYVPPPDCTGDDCDGTTNPPEDKLSCSVKSSAINLAYGSMPMGSASGKTASSEVNVNCNKAGAKISFSLKSGGDTITLSNGMKTRLTVGGKDVGSTITGAKGNNYLKVIGTLSGKEVEGGFTGTGVLVADYQ